MRETLRRIGSAIRRASVYPPIRNHAAAIASLAPPKNFVAQLALLYGDFIRRWRYVKDPVSRELVTNSPEAIWRLTMAGDGIGVGLGRGAGDCDCATVALGAELESIGFKTRLGTTAPPTVGPGSLFSHVFIQAMVPKLGWITVDPVLHPKKPFGATADNSRVAFWDLDGNLIGFHGNYIPKNDFLGFGQMEENSMLGENIENWGNYGFGADEAEMGFGEPVDWGTIGLANWGWIPTADGNRVSAVGMYGIIDGANLGGLCAEVDGDDTWGYTESGQPLVRTPMIELSLSDYDYVRRNGRPYDGMLGLSDTGDVYQYSGLGGFFKKLFKRVKGVISKVRKKIRGGIKKLLKKSKFGRFLLKVGGKIRKIAMKIVRPLMKFVGKWAGKLAPIAAMIPGYGTAVAAALTAAGRVAKVMQKWGVSTSGAKGTVRRLKLQDPKKLPEFKRELAAEAAQMKAMQKSDPAKFQQLSTALRSRPPA
jgi:hypothetical protein